MLPKTQKLNPAIAVCGEFNSKAKKQVQVAPTNSIGLTFTTHKGLQHLFG
jgi:hypothetical protein